MFPPVSFYKGHWLPLVPFFRRAANVEELFKLRRLCRLRRLRTLRRLYTFLPGYEGVRRSIT